MILLASSLTRMARLFDSFWKFRKFVTCSFCSCHPQVEKWLFYNRYIATKSTLNTCSCSTDLAIKSLLGAVQVCCHHHQVRNRSKVVANRENYFTFSSRTDSTSFRSNYPFRLGKIRLPGTLIRIPEAF